MDVFPECKTCLATAFCKLYAKEVIPRNRYKCGAYTFLYRSLALSKIPKEYLNANIYNFSIDSENAVFYEKLKPFCDTILEVIDKGTNFLFCGYDNGTGKTFMASCLLNAYVYKTSQSEEFNFIDPMGLFVDYTQLIDDLRYADEDDGLIKLFNNIRKVPVLLLDDFGAGTISEFVKEQTFLIINYRYNHKLATIYTTNLLLQDIVRIFGGRIASRLAHDCSIFEVHGEDRR